MRKGVNGRTSVCLQYVTAVISSSFFCLFVVVFYKEKRVYVYNLFLCQLRCVNLITPDGNP